MLRKKLRDSSVILTEDHIYWLGEKRLSGITGVISKHLFPNKYKAVPEKVLQRAAKRGTAVHEALEVYDMFGVAETKEAKEYAKLKKDKGFEIIQSEYIVTDSEYFATPIDKLMIFPNTPENTIDLGDVKHTSVLDKEYLSWQLSIGKYLFNLVNPDIKIGKFYAIHTRGGVTLHEIDEIPQEEVIELLNCEVSGRMYKRKDVLTKVSENEIEIAQNMARLVVDMAEMQKKYDAFKEKLINVFETHNVEKWDNELFTISRIEGYDRESFDSKRFKEEHSELYNEYKKITNVKPSIRIKLK